MNEYVFYIPELDRMIVLSLPFAINGEIQDSRTMVYIGKL
jgi:hypothetical protein